MARPVIPTTDDPHILRPDSGETALDNLGKLELRGDSFTPAPNGRDTLRRPPAGRETNHRRRVGDLVKADEVLEFWFGREDEPGYGGFREEWFRKDPEFDRKVRDRFEGLHEQAAAGALDDWRQDARGCLALVIVLDQFPRNMYRGDPRSYATDRKAQETAEYAVDHALDRELPEFQRAFLYMPFMHSEDLEHQRSAVELFGKLQEWGGSDPTHYAVLHMEIVERFGRFPHRNEVLGRPTTPEEAEFLQEPGSSF
jgi:uncharacterized protein (DUF924 family)